MRYLPLILIATLAGCYSNDSERRCAAFADLWVTCEGTWEDNHTAMYCYAEDDYRPGDDGSVFPMAEVEPCETWNDVYADCNRRVGELDEGDEAWCYATTPPEARDNAECVQLAWYASGMMGNL